VSAYRGHVSDDAPRPVERALPRRLRLAIWLSPGGNLLLGLALAALAACLLPIGVALYRYGEGYDATATGATTSCYLTRHERSDDDRSKVYFIAHVTYQFVARTGERVDGDYEREQPACPADGSPVPVKYFPSTPRKNNHVDDHEYQPIGHVVAWGGAGGAALLAAVLLGRELARRARVLRAVRTGVLVHARLAGVGASRTVDFWGSTETDLRFELPGTLELIGPATVAAVAAARAMDDALEPLVLAPPHFDTAVAVDLVPGRLRLGATTVEAYQPAPLGPAPLLVGLVGAGPVIALAFALA
jgi:hypothetical protein